MIVTVIVAIVSIIMTDGVARRYIIAVAPQGPQFVELATIQPDAATTGAGINRDAFAG